VTADLTGTMTPEAGEASDLPDEMLKAFDIMAENPEQARIIAKAQGAGMADVSRSKVHWAGKPLPEFIHLYSDDGTPSVIPTARMGYYIAKGFHPKSPVERPIGTFMCPRPGCIRGTEGHGCLSEERLEDHIRTKHRRLWADMDRRRAREDKDAQALSAQNLLKELAALLRNTAVPNDFQERNEIGNATVLDVSIVEDDAPKMVKGQCPDCGKKIKNYKLHKPYCKGGNNA